MLIKKIRNYRFCFISLIVKFAFFTSTTVGSVNFEPHVGTYIDSLHPIYLKSGLVWHAFMQTQIPSVHQQTHWLLGLGTGLRGYVRPHYLVGGHIAFEKLRNQLGTSYLANLGLELRSPSLKIDFNTCFLKHQIPTLKAPHKPMADHCNNTESFQQHLKSLTESPLAKKTIEFKLAWMEWPRMKPFFGVYYLKKFKTNTINIDWGIEYIITPVLSILIQGNLYHKSKQVNYLLCQLKFHSSKIERSHYHYPWKAYALEPVDRHLVPITLLSPESQSCQQYWIPIPVVSEITPQTNTQAKSPLIQPIIQMPIVQRRRSVGDITLTSPTIFPKELSDNSIHNGTLYKKKKKISHNSFGVVNTQENILPISRQPIARRRASTGDMIGLISPDRLPEMPSYKGYSGNTHVITNRDSLNTRSTSYAKALEIAKRNEQLVHGHAPLVKPFDSDPRSLMVQNFLGTERAQAPALYSNNKENCAVLGSRPRGSIPKLTGNFPGHPISELPG